MLYIVHRQKENMFYSRHSGIVTYTVSVLYAGIA